MNYENDHREDELIDLGQATTETKGSGGPVNEDLPAHRSIAGLLID